VCVCVGGGGGMRCCSSLRHCATSRKVTGWDFSLTQSFRPHYGPGVDWVSNGNEYQEYFLGCKCGRYVGLTTLHLLVSIVLNSGSLNLLERLHPIQARTGIVLPLYVCSLYLSYLPTEIVEGYYCTWSHTHTHTHTRWNSPRRGIYPSQRPLPVQHRTLPQDSHPCPCGIRNPQSQQVSGDRPTPYTKPSPGSAFWNIQNLKYGSETASGPTQPRTQWT
jgi:hypothetical protein